MTHLSLDSPALQTRAREHESAAADLTEDGAGQWSAIDLAITFGIIGAEFLAAVLHALQEHTTDMRSIADRETTSAARTTQADTGYRDCDCTSAEQMAGQSTTSPTTTSTGTRV